MLTFLQLSAENSKDRLRGVNFGIKSLSSGWIVFVPTLFFYVAQKVAVQKKQSNKYQTTDSNDWEKKECAMQ